MAVLRTRVVPPKAGDVLEVRKGEHLRITDLEGKQVVDMAVFNRHNLRDKISTAYSRSRQPPRSGQGFRSLERVSASSPSPTVRTTRSPLAMATDVRR